MSSSAILMGLFGITSQFLPQEILISLNAEPNFASILILQICGALLLGFAMLNWMARTNLIGGIYSRPLAIGNLTHFAIGAITLTKIVFSNSDSVIIIVLTFTYILFALLFAKVVFTHPSHKN